MNRDDPTPQVSVLLPVWNGGVYLREALASVLDQRGVSLEVVAVDDGSTDGSDAVLAAAAESDPRLRVFSQENRGLGRTLIRAAEAASAPLLARLDADDRMLPGRLASQVAFLKTHPEVVCVGGAVRMMDGEGRFLTRLDTPVEDEAIQRDLLRGHTAIFHPAATFRADAYAEAGGYDPAFNLADDLHLWLRLGEVGALANLEQAVIDYRLHAGSLSEQRTAEQQAEVRAAVEQAWARRGITDGVLEHTRAWRPGRDRSSRARFALRYGWWALGSGEQGTARHYAKRALRAQPWNREAWALWLRSRAAAGGRP